MEIARNWRLHKQRYALQGAVCARCGEPNFPARPVCPHCGVVAGQGFVVGQEQPKEAPLAIEVARAAAFRQRGG